MITSVAWDDATEEMIVTFKNGRRAAYSGVTEQQANDLANAPSVGSAFNSEFKYGYQFRYV